MRPTFHAIYALVGAAVWLIFGTLITWLSTLEFGGWVSTLTARQGITYLIVLAGCGATVGFAQATSMAYGGRVRSPLFMAMIPFALVRCCSGCFPRNCRGRMARFLSPASRVYF